MIVVMQGFLWGLMLTGVASFMGFGVALAIDLFKSFGGVR